MRGLKRFVSHLFIFLLLHLASQASADDSSFSKFHISIWLNNGKIFQNNVNTVLNVAGYRLGKDPAYFQMTSPVVTFGFSYRWTSRLQSTITLATGSHATASFGNYTIGSNSSEKLDLDISSSMIGSNFDYLIVPYQKLWKNGGLQLTISSGAHGVALKESLIEKLPNADSSLTTFNAGTTSWGFVAQFAFEAAIIIHRNFSITPFRLNWSVPVLRPSFNQVQFETRDYHRSIGGRNYENGGLFWQIGAAYHF